MIRAAQSVMPPVAVIDVSEPPATSTPRRVALVAWDLILVTLLVLSLPLIFIIGAPVAFLALVGTMITQRFQKTHP